METTNPRPTLGNPNNPRPGDLFHVYDFDQDSGEWFHLGTAALIETVGWNGPDLHTARVQLPDGSRDIQTITPGQAQTDPEAYVARLNAERQAIRSRSLTPDYVRCSVPAPGLFIYTRRYPTGFAVELEQREDGQPVSSRLIAATTDADAADAAHDVAFTEISEATGTAARRRTLAEAFNDRVRRAHGVTA